MTSHGTVVTSDFRTHVIYFITRSSELSPTQRRETTINGESVSGGVVRTGEMLPV